VYPSDRVIIVDEATRAPLVRRFFALLVDWILCLLIAGLIGDPQTEPWIAPAVLVIEYTLFLGFFGQTPGMWVTRIRCVSLATGQAIGVPRALLRGFLLALFIPPLIMDQDQRGLHDKAAGSQMIKLG
jgi:uncharacterized RDD family membrane protein YckC